MKKRRAKDGPIRPVKIPEIVLCVECGAELYRDSAEPRSKARCPCGGLVEYLANDPLYVRYWLDSRNMKVSD